MSPLRVLHLCTTFDPAGDVVRCFDELKKYSRHEHRLAVRLCHPLQEIYKFPEADWLGPFMPSNQPMESIEWSDCVLYHLTGPHFPEYELPLPGWLWGNRPAGFRNLNIYYDALWNRFFCHSQYNAPDLSIFRLVASSHVGAKEFLGSERFRWLPDMIPIDDPAYMPVPLAERAGVSFLKHSEDFRTADFGVERMNLNNKPLSEVLKRNRSLVAIDNVVDGHYGLAGLECLSMGLPTIVYNHPATTAALRDIAPVESPFVEVEHPWVQTAISAARELLADPDRVERVGAYAREWMVKYHNSRSIIERFWDPFFDELVSV